jgi:hypothetical protein
MLFTSFSKPVSRLNSRLPDQNFNGFEAYLSVYSYFIISSIGQIITTIYFINEYPGEQPTPVDRKWNKNFKDSIEGAVIYLVGNIYIMMAGYTFYTSRPFKEIIFKNYCLILWNVLLSLYNGFFFFFPAIATNFSFNPDQ